MAVDRNPDFISAVYTRKNQLDEESFVREEPKVSGDRILSDNLINDMDTDNYLTIAPRDTESLGPNTADQV